jgi:hypothetical protein
VPPRRPPQRSRPASRARAALAELAAAAAPAAAAALRLAKTSSILFVGAAADLLRYPVLTAGLRARGGVRALKVVISDLGESLAMAVQGGCTCICSLAGAASLTIMALRLEEAQHGGGGHPTPSPQGKQASAVLSAAAFGLKQVRKIPPGAIRARTTGAA